VTTAEIEVAARSLREIVARILDTSVELVGDDASFYEDLAADSLEKVEIVVVVERRFGIKLSASEAAAMRSVRDAVTLLESKGVVAARSTRP